MNYQVLYIIILVVIYNTAFGQSSSGNALSTDDTSDFAYPLNPNAAGLSEGTVEFWFSADTWSGSEQIWGGGNGLPGTTGDWTRFGTHSSVGGYSLAFGMYAGGWRWASTGIQPDSGMWYHVAATWGPAGMKIYLNGSLSGQNGHSGGLHNYATELVAASAWGDAFNGDIDELRIWNVALDSTEISQTISDTLGPEYYSTIDSGLIAYYRMDELEDLGINSDGADDLRDFSINNNHLDSDGNITLDPSGAFAVTGINNRSINIPNDFELKQNYPNPFNPITNIKFDLSKSGQVKIEIFNTLGEKIQTIFSGFKSAGKHNIQFDASDFSSGVYFYQMETAGIKKSKKMILLR